jgi:RNA polymerase sigma-70 factor (ECF subfamily)
MASLRQPLTDEAQRVALLKQRDPVAFNGVVVDLQGRVFRLCFRIIGSRADAEEVAQDVFVQVFREIESFRGESQLSSWILRIAVNLSKNRVVHLARRKESVGLQEATPVEVGAAARDNTRPDRVLESRQLGERLQACLQEIEPDFRAAVVLRDVEGFSYEDIQEVLGVPMGTVKSRVARGRAAMRQLLTNDGLEGDGDDENG